MAYPKSAFWVPRSGCKVMLGKKKKDGKYALPMAGFTCKCNHPWCTQKVFLILTHPMNGMKWNSFSASPVLVFASIACSWPVLVQTVCVHHVPLTHTCQNQSFPIWINIISFNPNIINQPILFQSVLNILFHLQVYKMISQIELNQLYVN